VGDGLRETYYSWIDEAWTGDVMGGEKGSRPDAGEFADLHGIR